MLLHKYTKGQDVWVAISFNPFTQGSNLRLVPVFSAGSEPGRAHLSIHFSHFFVWQEKKFPKNYTFWKSYDMYERLTTNWKHNTNFVLGRDVPRKLAECRVFSAGKKICVTQNLENTHWQFFEHFLTRFYELWVYESYYCILRWIKCIREVIFNKYLTT
jgi:hypothetical protein